MIPTSSSYSLPSPDNRSVSVQNADSNSRRNAGKLNNFGSDQSLSSKDSFEDQLRRGEVDSSQSSRTRGESESNHEHSSQHPANLNGTEVAPKQLDERDPNGLSGGSLALSFDQQKNSAAQESAERLSLVHHTETTGEEASHSGEAETSVLNRVLQESDNRSSQVTKASSASPSKQSESLPVAVEQLSGDASNQATVAPDATSSDASADSVGTSTGDATIETTDPFADTDVNVLDSDPQSLPDKTSDSAVKPVSANDQGSMDSSDQSLPFEMVRPTSNRNGKQVSSLSRTEFANTMSVEVGRSVSQRVSDRFIQEATLLNTAESKQITMQLHPAELGRLTLHVGWESEAIVAKIIASEQATMEMLNNDKSWLLDALQSNGVDVESFDISYDGSSSEQPNSFSGPAASDRRDSTAENQPANSIIQQGVDVDGMTVNLIA